MDSRSPLTSYSYQHPAYDIDSERGDELPELNELISTNTKKSSAFSRALGIMIILSVISVAVIWTPQLTPDYKVIEFIERGAPLTVLTDPELPSVEKIPDNGKPLGNSIPMLLKAPIRSSKITFGLNRVGYSYIPVDNDPLSYALLQDQNTIIEPYSPLQLWLSSADDSMYYKFSVCNLVGECQNGVYSSSSDYNSRPVRSVPCSPREKMTVSFEAYSIATDNMVGTKVSGNGVCMYVRREIRTLTNDDLAKTMDAMYTMWATTDEDGLIKYGKNYKSASYFTNMHHFNAAWQDSDHVHEGNGFLLQHLKMTNVFELAMQSVDPSVSLPYWDYTIESSLSRNAFNSYIMTADIFGSMGMPKDVTYGFGPANDNLKGAAILDGRWAYIKAEKTDKYPELKHPFGFLRAPWNMNPSPYVSRYTADYRIGTNLPACTSHYKLLQKESMMDFFYESAYDAHATTHSLIGGIYGCELMKPLLDAGYINSETDMKQICSKWVFQMKELYRSNFIIPRTDCIADEVDPDSSRCGFTCSDETVSAVKTNLKNRLNSHIPSTIDDDGLTAWYDFVCTGDGYRIFAGDHLESASPADPSFWVIHPTLDRLFQAKMMMGGFEDSAWASDIVNDFVCEKSKCYEADLAGKSKISTYEECCYGHYENDRLYDPEMADRSYKTGPTNAEMVAMSTPTSTDYKLNYVYDSFSWTHCSDDFNALLTGTASIDLQNIDSGSDEFSSVHGARTSDSPVLDDAKNVIPLNAKVGTNFVEQVQNKDIGNVQNSAVRSDKNQQQGVGGTANVAGSAPALPPTESCWPKC